MHFFCYSDPAPWTVRQRSAWFLEVCRDRARLHCNPARAQAVIVSVVGVAMLMPIGVILTKACGGTCCGLFSCCGLTWIAWLALKALMFAAWLPVRILCCVRRFERDRQARRPAGPCLSAQRLWWLPSIVRLWLQMQPSTSDRSYVMMPVDQVVPA